MEFNERPNEPFLFFAADKTDPGAFNLPLYLAFTDPMNTPGLILAPSMARGFLFVIMDVNHTEGDRIIELNARKELYEIAALLRDPERYVVESVWSVAAADQAVVAPTSRLHNIAGKYTGKDDPVMLVRVQEDSRRRARSYRPMQSVLMWQTACAAMLPMAELEYTGIMENLKAVEPRFRVRTDS
jgi:fructose 1,6-bisphosphate aldolase/phosphatase